MESPKTRLDRRYSAAEPYVFAFIEFYRTAIIFNKNGELIHSVNGEAEIGSWEIISVDGSVLIHLNGEKKLYSVLVPNSTTDIESLFLRLDGAEEIIFLTSLDAVRCLSLTAYTYMQKLLEERDIEEKRLLEEKRREEQIRRYREAEKKNRALIEQRAKEIKRQLTKRSTKYKVAKYCLLVLLGSLPLIIITAYLFNQSLIPLIILVGIILLSIDEVILLNYSDYFSQEANKLAKKEILGKEPKDID